MLLTGIGGSCTQLLAGGGSPPTVGGHEQHLETQEKRGSGNFSIGIKRTLYLKALGRQQIILMSWDGLSSTFPVVQVKTLTLNDCNCVPEMAAPWVFSEHMLSGLSDEICKWFLLSAPSLTSKAQS